MMKIVKRFINFIYDIVFTVKCPYCRAVIPRREFACENCKKKFPKHYIKTYTVGEYTCVAPFVYKDIYAKAVKNFKFKSNGVFAKQLSVMMVSSINREYGNEKFDIITCVPMHKNSLKERRYNHSELLARECAEKMNIPFVQTLEKHKNNQAQHKIKASMRADNVRGVYRTIDKELVRNKNILLIDDIITTGNTLGECAKMLRLAGCKSIRCATFCVTATGNKANSLKNIPI